MALLGGEAPERCRRLWNITAFGVKLLGAWRGSLATRAASELPLLPQSIARCAKAAGAPLEAPGAIRGS